MMSSQWLFSDEEAERMVSEVYKEYTKLFRQDPLSGARISLAKFPRDVKPGDWEAETRANNVTIISSDMPFKTQSLQRLHEQLRHELFHLWIPNGVNLTGNYDWFYEGFALYQSLKLAVALNRIRFEDFLDTLSRAHTIDNGAVAKDLAYSSFDKSFWRIEHAGLRPRNAGGFSYRSDDARAI
jgi:predicted metalloprotease with PDZ domain